jgi:hypothetical protein
LTVIATSVGRKRGKAERKTEKAQPWIIDEYATPRGEKPILSFLDSLSAEDQAHAAALIELLRERGNTLREPESKALGEGLFELRRKRIRMFFVFRPGRRALLIDGIVKKRRDIPPDVLERMRKLADKIP